MSTARLILPKLWACEAPSLVQKPALVARLDTISSEPVAPRLAFYRKYTEGMLRRYLRFSLEAGRVPSMLGRELFRGKVSSYRAHSFEDAVIFVHDVEKCLARLDRMQQLLILKIAVQEYTQEEAASLMRVPFRTVRRRYHLSIDALTTLFLQTRLLDPLVSCQEAGTPKFQSSCS
jgi:hypothetical protein